VSEQLGDDRLDALIGNLDFDGIEAALGGFLTLIRNQSAVDGTPSSGQLRRMFEAAEQVASDIESGRSDLNE